MKPLAGYRRALKHAAVVRRIGHVSRLGGLSVEVHGLDATIGEFCSIRRRGAAHVAQAPVLAEVVAVKGDHLALMPYGPLEGLAAGCEVLAEGAYAQFDVGDALLGRVIDAFGRPLDGGKPAETTARRPLRAHPINPMQRPRIARSLETGVRSIDTLLTLGQGQRMGIFAGSGVGKSTLLGMLARHVRADVNVIALIGERGREVKEFVDRQLGPEKQTHTSVVVAASDQPALARLRAAHAALAIAESFRDQGRQVLLTMDSVTRFAMA